MVGKNQHKNILFSPVIASIYLHINTLCYMMGEICRNRCARGLCAGCVRDVRERCACYTCACAVRHSCAVRAVSVQRSNGVRVARHQKRRCTLPRTANTLRIMVTGISCSAYSGLLLVGMRRTNPCRCDMRRRLTVR